MKNAYAVKLKEQRKKRDFENTKEGFDFALNLFKEMLEVLL